MGNFKEEIDQCLAAYYQNAGLTEREYEDLILFKPELLNKKFIAINRQIHVDPTELDKKVDVILLDNLGYLYVVEIKRDEINYSTYLQGKEYLDILAEKSDLLGFIETEFTNHWKKRKLQIKVKEQLEEEFKDKFPCEIYPKRVESIKLILLGNFIEESIAMEILESDPDVLLFTISKQAIINEDNKGVYHVTTSLYGSRDRLEEDILIEKYHDHTSSNAYNSRNIFNFVDDVADTPIGHGYLKQFTEFPKLVKLGFKFKYNKGDIMYISTDPLWQEKIRYVINYNKNTQQVDVLLEVYEGFRDQVRCVLQYIENHHPGIFDEYRKLKFSKKQFLKKTLISNDIDQVKNQIIWLIKTTSSRILEYFDNL